MKHLKTQMISRVLCSLVLLAGITEKVQAINSYYWVGRDWTSGAAYGAYWTYNNNWSTSSGGSGLGSKIPTLAAYLNFDGSAATPVNGLYSITNDFPAGTNGYQIYFKSTAPAYSLYGSSLTFYDFSGSDPNIQNEGTANTQTFNFAVTNGNNNGTFRILNINLNASPAQGPITFNGQVYGGASDANSRVINIGGGNITFNNSINNGAGGGALALTMLGAGTVKLAATNTFTGDLSINAGTVVLATNSAVSASGAIRLGDVSGSTGANLNMNGGNTVSALVNARATSGTKIIANTSGTAGAATFAGNLYLDGDATLYANTGGGNVLSGTTLDLKNQTLTADGPGTNFLTGVLANSIGSGKLVKNNTGLLTLSGINTYSGATTINAGELIGVTGGSCSNSAVTIVGATNGVLITSVGGRWACGTLTYSSGTTYADFNFGAIAPSTTTAPLLVNGNLVFTVTPTVLVRSSAGIAVGTYPLIKYTGTLSGTPPTTALTLFAGYAATLVNNTGNKSIDLVVSTVSWAAGSGTWDINTTANWKNSALASVNYLDGESALFEDTLSGTGPIAVTLNTTVNPPSVTVSNFAKNYTISGSGGINGVGGLTKYGTGSLTLSSSNAYTGGTVVNAGTVTLDFNASGAPISSIVSASSALTLGGSTLNINGKTGTASSQTFNGLTLNAGGSTISAAPASGANNPTLTLGAMSATPTAGATIEFVGPATINSSGNVAATATITTTTAGTGTLGAINALGNGKNGSFATVGLYDWPSTDLANGTAGTSPYTIVGGSQVTGFYQTTGVNSGGNYDVNSGGVNSIGNAGGAATLRFNQNSALTVSFTASFGQNMQGVLVTPKCGAFNETVGGAGILEFIRSTSGGNSYGVLWQNNTLGYLNVSVILGAGRQSGQNNGLVQAGPGTVVYSGINTYELGAYLNGGFSVATADSGFGAVANASTATLNGGTIVGNATFTMDNAGANKRPIALGSNGGGLAATAGNTMTIDGVVSGAAGTGPLTIGIPASSANGNVLGLLPGSGTGTANTTPVNATGTVVLNSGANTYTGGTVLSSGTLQFTNGCLGTGGVTFGGGTLQYGTSTTTDISSQTVTVNSGGGTIDVNGNTVTLANAIGNSGSGALTVKSTAANGSLTLSGANTYTGGTTLSSGILIVNNSTGSGTGSGTVTLNGGTLKDSGTISGNVAVNPGATLGGSGTIGGLVTASSGGIIAPGSSVGILTVGSLTMSSGSTNNFEFNSTPANDKIVVTTSGGLTINGGTFNLYQEGTTLAWQPAATTTYNLIQFSGTAPSLDSTWTTDSSSNPHIANPVAGYTYQFGISGSYLTLKVTVAATLGSWNVDNSGNWTITGNWLNGSVPGANSGSSGDTATFAGVTTTAARTVTLDANEAVGAIAMNQANSFTIADSGLGNTLTLDNKSVGASVSVTAGTANAIQTGVALNDNASISVSSGKSLAISGVVSNATGVTKTLTFNGAGTNVLSAANSYGPSAGTVGTTLSAGTLQVGNNNALGAGDLSVSANSTLQAGTSVALGNNIALGSSVTATVDANSTSLSLSGTISGSSAIVNKNTAGTLTLSGANTYGGGTTLSAGQLNINNGGDATHSAIGTGALTISGGTLDNTSSGDVTLAPNNAQNWNGDFTYAGSAYNLNFGSGAVALGASRQVTVSANTLTVGGIISGSSFGLTKAGGGTLVLSGANTFSGTTAISGGTLTLGNSLALQNSTLNYNNQGGTLSFGSLTAALIAGLTGSQNLNYGSVNLNLGTNNTTSSYSGLLSGSGQLQKSGTGTLTLANPGYTGNTYVYNGGFNITGGTLTSHIDLSAQYGTVNASISGATVTSSSGLYITSPSPGSGGGAVYGSAGNLTITNGAQVTANADGNGRAISYGNGSNFRPGGNGSLTIGTTGDTTTLVTANGVLDMFATAGGGTAGNFTVNLNGGTLAVNSIKESTYGSQSGTFKFNGGTLKAMADDPSGSVFFIPATPSQFTTPIYAGGAIIDANSHNITIASVLSHGGGTPDGGLTKMGSGTLTLASTGNTYTGLTTIQGGTLSINSEWALGGANYSGLTFSGSGGTLQYASTLLNATTDISVQPVSLNANAVIDVNGNAINFANAIGNSGTGSLTVNSTVPGGVLTLSGANTYTGPTTVNTGTLLISGSIGTNTLTVNTNATVSGTGTINGATTVKLGGTLQAGLGGGDFSALAVSNSLVLAGNAVFNLDRTNSSVPTANKISGLTSVTYGGTLTVTNLGPALSAGDTFTLFQSAAYAGGFTNIVLPSLTAGLGWNTNNLAVNGTLSVMSLLGVAVVPATTNVTYGTSVTLTANVTGSGPFTYQWFDNNTNAITGQTNSTLTVAPAVAASGNYTVVASNLGGSATNLASVTISTAPLSITANNDTKTYGQTKTYGSGSTSFTSIGLQNSESIGSVTIIASGGTNATDAVGGYTLAMSAATGGTFNPANYSLTYSNGMLTVNALAVVLSGTRAYDGTTTAAAGILSVANKVGVDDVTVASGSATLAGASVTTQSITSFGSLALGGTTAGNYTFTGASGAVVITAASTATAVVSSSNPAGYLDTLTFTANVSPTNASGSVTFSANGTPFSTNTLVAGVAVSGGINSLARGTNTILAVYGGDVNYLSSSNTLAQVVTNHTPVAGNISYTVAAGVVSLQVAVSNLLATVSDTDGDSITLVSLGNSTNGVTPVIAGNLVQYYNTNGVNDQFSYTVSDSFGGTNIAYVSIVVSNSIVGQVTGVFTSFTGGVANLTFHGIPNLSYVAERSTNLADWVDVVTNTAATNGVINISDYFYDLGGTPPASAYYRLKWQP